VNLNILYLLCIVFIRVSQGTEIIFFKFNKTQNNHRQNESGTFFSGLQCIFKFIPLYAPQNYGSKELEKYVTETYG